MSFTRKINEYCSKEDAKKLKAISETALVQFNKKIDEYASNGSALNEIQEAALFAQCLECGVLKAPATAVFPGLDEMKVTADGENYLVSGYVDAQNSYGGFMRTNYSYVVSKKNGYWESVSLTPENSTKALLWTVAIIVFIILAFFFF